LEEIKCYKYFFINKFKGLEILDGYKITEIDVDLAKNYMEELSKKNENNDDTKIIINNVQESEKDNSEINNEKYYNELDNDFNNENNNHSKSISKKSSLNIKEKTHIEVKGKIIDKIEYVKEKKITINPKSIANSKMKISTSDLQNKLKETIAENKLQKSKIETLELQLENVINLNKELEREKMVNKDISEEMKPIIQQKDKSLKYEK